MIKNILILSVLLAVFIGRTVAGNQHERPRVIVTTDGEADDRASMVRFLLTSNEFEIEGIINSSSQFHWVGGEGWNAFHEPSWIKEYIELYSKVYQNLLLHDPNYPSPDFLLSKWKVGNINGVGEDSIRTEGAQLIAKVLLDTTDSRPVWIQAWGGCNTISRALKIIQEDHPVQMAKVAKKMRLFLIWEQDETYQNYIRPNWEKFNIPTIISDQFDCMAYIWSKVLPDDLKTYFEAKWMTENIVKGHGPLCDIYENNRGAFNAEGDTPSFLHNIPNGLRNMETPGNGGWGGRYVKVRNNVWMDPLPDSTYSYPTGQWGFHNSWSKKMEHDTAANKVEIRTNYFKPIWRWLDDVQNDFAVRADWCVMDYEHANHAPIVELKGETDLTAVPGETINLAGIARDPDGDQLRYSWWQYTEAGTFKDLVNIKNPDSLTSTVTIPASVEKGDRIHFILEVSDSGSPVLTRYARVIITIG